jgi:FkbM family methyltransferase
MDRRRLRNPRWLRAVRYRLAADAAYTAVRAAGLELIVPTRDRLGERLFVNQKRSDFRVLPRAVDLLGEPHGTFVDVGANIGTSTLLALKLGFPRVVAIEPHPENLRVLRANVILNGYEDAVTVVAAGASDEPGTGHLRRHPLNVGAHRLVSRSRTNSIEVPLVTLDAVVPDDASLLWLDTQGSEEAILAGAPRTLSRRPALVLEVGAGEALPESVLDYPRFHDLRRRCAVEADYVPSTDTDILVW